MKNNTLNKAIVIAWTAVISSALFLWAFIAVTGETFDVELKGYTDSQVEVPFSGENYRNGSFQSSVTTAIENSLPVRGYLVKTYNTIRYKIFNLGNNPIGESGSIFEEPYLLCTNAIGEYNYADSEKDRELQDMVDCMESVNEKLKNVGKYLFVYVAPTKSSICPEDMPKKYRDLTEPGAVSVTEAFRNKISRTEVPYVFCDDYKSELEYPAFYSTGIHWSRTYGQISSRNMIDELRILTGKNYRNMQLTDVETSTESFWKDTDVYDLLNVWPDSDVPFYQYTVNVPERSGYDTFNLLVMGDSFAQDILKDIGENLPENKTAYINRDDLSIDITGRYRTLNDDWDELDWQYFLDCTDIVAVEMVEPEIRYYTFGFLDYLDNYLDSYVPVSREAYYLDGIDCSYEQTINLNYGNGIYGREAGFTWINPACSVTLKEKALSESGLEMVYQVPDQIFAETDADIVSVYVNGRLKARNTYTSPCRETVIIPFDQLGEAEAGGYSIEIYATAYFNPKECEESDDDRDLALRLEYIGGIR